MSSSTIGDAPHGTSPASEIPALSEIDLAIARLEQEKEALLRKKEEEQNSKVKEREAIIAEFRGRLGATNDQELIMIIRNRIAPNSKAKRLPESTLRQMKTALARGATAPDVAKFFRVSLATVHSRKAQWKLTHRKNVKAVGLTEALKGVS